jgi:alcohol dehydrogenase class IV
MEFNSREVSDIYATVGIDMGVSANSATAIEAVRDLSDSINIRNSLSHYGVKQEMIGDITKTVLADSVTGNNPIAPTDCEVQAILTSRL